MITQKNIYQKMKSIRQPQLLTNLESFDPKKLVFHEVSEKHATKTKKYKQIALSYRSDVGDSGDLILVSPPDMFTWGVQEDVDFMTKRPNGRYKMGIVMWDEERKDDHFILFRVLKQISDEVKNHLATNADLKEYYSDCVLPAMYYKKDKNTKVQIPNAPPTLYVKLSQKGKNVQTGFFDELEKAKISHTDLIGKAGRVRFGLHIESIYLGQTGASIQLKMTQVFSKIKLQKMQMLMGFDEEKNDNEYEV
jgi:hypothetical protein